MAIFLLLEYERYVVKAFGEFVMRSVAIESMIQEVVKDLSRHLVKKRRKHS